MDMRGYKSVKEAAAMLQKAEKQIYRYIKLRRLPGAVMVGKVYFIPIEDIEALQSKPGRYREDAMTKRLRLLEDRISLLEGEMSRLKGQVEDLEKGEDPDIGHPFLERQTIDTGPIIGAASALPHGYVSLAAFYKRHSIPEATATRFVTGMPDRITEGHWSDRGHVVKMALSPDQQVIFVSAMKSHPRFTPCGFRCCESL